MKSNELRGEINFGLENLEKIYQRISEFSQLEIDERLKVSALAYECLGYYNAIEHLIIRILKYLKVKIPSGPFSHKNILKIFISFLREKKVEENENIIKVIENLMAFRHVATKVYGFLINWNKLKSIINDIEANNIVIKKVFINILNHIKVDSIS